MLSTGHFNKGESRRGTRRKRKALVVSLMLAVVLTLNALLAPVSWALTVERASGTADAANLALVPDSASGESLPAGRTEQMGEDGVSTAPLDQGEEADAPDAPAMPEAEEGAGPSDGSAPAESESPVDEDAVSDESDGDTPDAGASLTPTPPAEADGEMKKADEPDRVEADADALALKETTVFYLDAAEGGYTEFTTLAEAAAAAVKRLDAESSITLWAVKDFTATATVELAIPAGKTLLIKSSEAIGTGKRSINHGSFDKTLFWVKSGTLRFEDVTVDGKGVDASATVATYGAAGLAVVGTGENVDTSARLELGSGATFQNGKSTYTYGAGGVALLGHTASLGMEDGSLAQNCTGAYAGFVTLWSYGNDAPAEFMMGGAAAIRSCVSTVSGGAVTIAEGVRSGQVTLRDNAEISGCTARSYGSAIYVAGTGTSSFVRIRDAASIHGNKVTGKAYLSGSGLNDFGRAAAVTMTGGGVPIILSGSPAFYGNVAADGIANDIFASDDAGGQIRVAGTLAPGAGSTGIWVSTYNRRASGEDFAAAYDMDGSQTVPALTHTGYEVLRNAIAKNTGAKVDLWGAAGEGSKVVWSSALTVTFNANGGTFGTALAKAVRADGSLGAWKAPAAPSEVTAPADYLRLEEWNTKADGTGESYAPGAALTASIIVYAQWANDAGKTFSIAYDANGGHFPDGKNVRSNVGIPWDEGNPPIAPAVGDPVRDETYTDASGQKQVRYTFVGWSASEQAIAPDFTPGESRLASLNQTVYAVWRDESPDADAESPWRLYVSRTGNDTSGTGTRSKPYRTFDKAFKTVKAASVSQGEGAGGTVPKDPDHPELTWATVVLMGNWQLGEINAAATQRADAGISVTVRGEAGSEVVSIGANAASTDLFTLPAFTKLTLKKLTVDGKGVSGNHQAVYANGRADLTFGAGFTLRNWISTAEPAVHLTGFGADNAKPYGAFTMRRGSLIENCSNTGTAGREPWANAWQPAGGAVNVNGAALVTMQAGSTIRNCTAPGSVGGAIFLYGAGTASHAQAAILTIDANALITGCSAATAGGAVYRSNNGIVELYGSITKCEAGSGGAIGDNDYLATNSQYFPPMSYVRMHPGSYVGQCKATGTQNATPIPVQGAGFGGAFGSSTYSNFLLHGGVIEDCTAAKGSGGAVGGYAPNVWMKEGMVIRGCSAGYGGALALTESALFEGGLIEDCKATGGATAYGYSNGHGGAIEISSNENPHVWMDLTIRNCTATAGGGGVSINIVDSYDRIYIYGLTITGCSAPVGGGFETNNLAGGNSPSFMDAAQLAAFNKTYANYMPGGVRTPYAPIVIAGNTDGQGNASNLQTFNQNTFGIKGKLVEGSSVGVTTGKMTSNMNGFNKEGAQFAINAGSAAATAAGSLAGTFFSDKDDTLVGFYQNATPVWAKGWTVAYDLNAPRGIEGFAAKDMPRSQRAGISEKMSVAKLAPAQTAPAEGARFTFEGWSVEADGEVVLEPGESLGTYEEAKAKKLDTDADRRIVLYARWKAVPPTFELPNTGGEGILGITAAGLTLIAVSAFALWLLGRRKEA